MECGTVLECDLIVELRLSRFFCPSTLQFVAICAGGANDSQDASDKTYYVMLPPELCFVHPLPGPLVRGAQRLPSVMRRVESMLLAIQLKHRINYPIAASKVCILRLVTFIKCVLALLNWLIPLWAAFIILMNEHY